jgi:citrate lyase subunit beta/citryl-CoA lyase
MKAKSDCVVAYTPSDLHSPGGTRDGTADGAVGSIVAGSALSIRVDSTVGALFNKAIEATARNTALEFGVVSGILSIDDDGALDFVVAARVEASLRAAGFSRSAAFQHSGTALKMAVSGTQNIPRRRRSRMYIPGNQPDLLPNAGLFGADCLVFDLEDSVPPSHKAEARILLRRALQSHRDFFPDVEIIVRINPLSGNFGRDDVEELADCLPDAILLPKCESPAQITELVAILDRLSGNPVRSVHIMPLIETAQGVLSAAAIAKASPCVKAICFGAEDFTRDIGARRTETGTETLFARQAIVIAAKAAGIQAHDSVFSNVDDLAGLYAYCAASRAMGFDGVGLLHPRQIAVAHKAFCPDASELEEARRTIAAFDEAGSNGFGVASLDGRMIDAPVVERARRIVALSDENSKSGKGY